MESRLEEVTRRLKETEKSLADIYQQEKQIKTDNNWKSTFWSSSVYDFCPQADNKLGQLQRDVTGTDPSTKQVKSFFNVDSNVKYDQNTPSGSELNFESDKLISSTPKNNEDKMDWKMKEKILKERILDLQSELKNQDQILREAEERFEQAQQETANAFQEKECLKELVADLTSELTEMKQLRKREKEDIRKQFDEYQLSSKEKNQLIEAKMLATDAERHELLQNISSLQAKLNKVSDEATWFHVENSQILEERNHLEEENTILKTKLASAKKSVVFNEVASSELENLEQESLQLHCQLEKQTHQLKQFEIEREDIKTAFVQYLHLLENGGHQDDVPHASKNISLDSGNLSWKNENKGHASKFTLVSDLETLMKISIPNACYSLLADFREKFVSKDSLIQKMKGTIESLEEELHQREGMQSLQDELQQMTKRCFSNEQKVKDLMASNEFLKQQTSNFQANIETLKFQLAESEAKTEKLDFCIGQRNTHLIELQEEINKKCSEVCQLERKLRNKSCEVTSLEQQLEEKVVDFSSHLTKYKGIEEQIKAYEVQLDQSTIECNRFKLAMEKMTKDKEKLIQFHSEKLQDRKKQIESLQENSLNQRELNSDLSKQIDALSEEVGTKTEKLKDMELELNQILQKLSQKTEELDDVKLQLNFQTSESKSRINQMETSIDYLKAEISRTVKDMKENKKLYSDQIAQYGEKEKSLLGQLKVLKQAFKDKEQECIGLQQTLQQNEFMLDQSNKHISHLEDSQANTQKEMSKLEQHLLVERSQQMELVQSLKQKSDHFQKIAEQGEIQIKELTETIHELQASKMSVAKQLAEINSRLQQEQEEGLRKTASLGFMKEQYQQSNEELHHHKNTVRELEHHVKVQSEEINAFSKENRELNKSVASLKVKVDEQKVLKEKLEHHISDMDQSLNAKEEICKDLGEAIKKLQNEISMKNDNIDDLQNNLEEQQGELDNRATKVSELVTTMSEYQKEMEGRVTDLENRLKCAENDIKEKTEQIWNYKEQYETTFVELQDKSNLLEHADQTCHKLQLELTEKKASLQNLTKTVQNMKEREKESQRNKTEITQELRLTRERLQSQTNDFILARHQLEQLRHEHDKLVQQLDNMAATTNTKEMNIAQLVEENNALRVEKVQIETKMSAEIKQLQQEVKMEQQAHTMELERLKETQGLLQASKDELSELLNQTNQQKLKNGSKHEQEMNSVKASLHLLQEELKIQKENVASLNETLVLKDVALSKLQSDLKSYEKKFLNMKILQLEQNAVTQPKSVSFSTIDAVLNPDRPCTVESSKTEESSNLLEMICKEKPENDLHPDTESLVANSQTKAGNQVPFEKSFHNLKLDTTTPAFEKIRKMLVGLTASLPLHEDSIGTLSFSLETSPDMNPALSLEPSSFDHKNPESVPQEKISNDGGKTCVPIISTKPDTFQDKPLKSDLFPTFELHDQQLTSMKSPSDVPEERKAYMLHLQQRISANEQLQEEIDIQLQKLQQIEKAGSKKPKTFT